jgi:hypothetical protein
MLTSLAAVEAAIRGAWGADTTYATDAYLARGAGRPARGQCGSTALVVHDLLGGSLMIADVEYAGAVDGVHYWNRLPCGLEVDLTREQFLPQEVLARPRSVERRTELPAPERARTAYLLFRRRVRSALDVQAPATPGHPRGPDVS